MKIGLLSDTHGYYDPQLHDVFGGVNAIIHAGDIGSKEVLDELSLIAPVEAVRGNIDSEDSRRPLVRLLDWEGVRLEILHILAAPQTELERWSRHSARGGAEGRKRERFLQGFRPTTRVIIFGHSHDPCVATLDGRLFVNPGSAGKKRFSLPRSCALMELTATDVEVKILSLDYNQTLKSMKLNFGE
jgi:putative phosphoesterase